MDPPQAQIIEQEIHDLSGLLCDLYRRVAENAPERAGTRNSSPSSRAN